MGVVSGHREGGWANREVIRKTTVEESGRNFLFLTLPTSGKMCLFEQVLLVCPFVTYRHVSEGGMLHHHICCVG